MRSKEFTHTVFNDLDHEDLLVEIKLDGSVIAVISQEQGIENAILELFQKANKTNLQFNYQDFMSALGKAYNHLKSLKKIE